MFKIGDKVRVVKPIISGCEADEGKVIFIDNTDDRLPIKVKLNKFSKSFWKDFESLYFNEKELMLID